MNCVLVANVFDNLGKQFHCQNIYVANIVYNVVHDFKRGNLIFKKQIQSVRIFK